MAPVIKVACMYIEPPQIISETFRGRTRVPLRHKKEINRKPQKVLCLLEKFIVSVFNGNIDLIDQPDTDNDLKLS